MMTVIVMNTTFTCHQQVTCSVCMVLMILVATMYFDHDCHGDNDNGCARW